MSKLTDEEFRQLIKNAPLVSIDLIVRNLKKQILLKLRVNEPAKDNYFVPGGRIRKGETRDQSIKRISKDELGFEISLKEARLKGVYEHLYTTNRFLDPNFGTQYVVLAYEVSLKGEVTVPIDEDHSAILWIDEAELKKRSDVNQYVKDFFQEFSVEGRTEKELEYFVGAGISYEALMHHYVHYDEQLWDRTQLVIYVQGAAFAASWVTKVVNTPLAAGIMGGAFILTSLILRLMWLDFKNSRINQDTMDEIAKIISINIPARAPRMRSENKFSGRYVLLSVVIGLLISDLALVALHLLNVVPQIW